VTWTTLAALSALARSRVALYGVTVAMLVAVGLSRLYRRPSRDVHHRGVVLLGASPRLHPVPVCRRI
jgi:hypothetical protein